MRHYLFENKKILITAGATWEIFDPIDNISDYSTGQMGYAIAESFLDAGAAVILVSGPVNLELKHPNLKLIRVTTALEMKAACGAWFDEIDFAIFAATVADYRPRVVSERMVKVAGDEQPIMKIKNQDIAFEFGRIKKEHQFSVGFVPESDRALVYALDTLYKKNLDIIILPSLSDKGNVSGQTVNKVTILNRELETHSIELTSTSELAGSLFNEIAEFASSINYEGPETLVA